MIRIQVLLTEAQSAALERLAYRRHASKGSILREALDSLIAKEISPIPREVLVERALSIAGKYRSGRSDISQRHDEFLFDEPRS
jgi:hypothetical protein